MPFCAIYDSDNTLAHGDAMRIHVDLARLWCYPEQCEVLIKLNFCSIASYAHYEHIIGMVRAPYVLSIRLDAAMLCS